MLGDNETKRILVVDDDEDLRVLVTAILAERSFEILEAGTGQEALSLALDGHPDLILLDLEMPGMSGLEVLSKLRQHIQTRHIPVLVLSGRTQLEDRVLGLEAGADDYILKPFEPKELMARVVVALRRNARDLAADPLTKLPGNLALQEELERRSLAGTGFAIAYIDLDHFKAYVDGYGFDRASSVIQRVAQILYNTLVDHGTPEDFVGHIGGDDFLYVVDLGGAEELCQEVSRRFREVVPDFYRQDDFERGYLEGLDRFGVERQFSLLDLSIAVIEVAPDAPPERHLLAAFAAVCKGTVKRASSSGKVRRFTYPGPGPERDPS